MKTPSLSGSLNRRTVPSGIASVTEIDSPPEELLDDELASGEERLNIAEDELELEAGSSLTIRGGSYVAAHPNPLMGVNWLAPENVAATGNVIGFDPAVLFDISAAPWSFTGAVHSFDLLTPGSVALNPVPPAAAPLPPAPSPPPVPTPPGGNLRGVCFGMGTN